MAGIPIGMPFGGRRRSGDGGGRQQCRATVADRFVNRRTHDLVLVFDIEPGSGREGFRATTVLETSRTANSLPAVGDVSIVEADLDRRTVRLSGTTSALGRFLAGFPETPF
jgi:hypothetical protein